MAWWMVALFVASLVVSYVARPRTKTPEKLRPSTMDQPPIGEIGKSIPILFGTRTIHNPNIVWWGPFIVVQRAQQNVQRSMFEDEETEFRTQAHALTPYVDPDLIPFGDVTLAQHLTELTNVVDGLEAGEDSKKVLVSDDDTTEGFLADKLVQGSNVTITPSGPGNQTLTIAASFSPSYPVTSVFSRTGAVSAASGDYDADEVDYTGSESGLSATHVQGAIDELAGIVAEIEPGEGGGITGPNPSTIHSLAVWDDETGESLEQSTIRRATYDTADWLHKARGYGADSSTSSITGTPHEIDWRKSQTHVATVSDLGEEVSFTFVPPALDVAGSCTCTLILYGFAGTVSFASGGGVLVVSPETIEVDQSPTVFRFVYNRFDTSDHRFFFLTGSGAGGGSGEDFWHGPYGLSYEMREESSLAFAWRAKADQIARYAFGPVIPDQDLEHLVDTCAVFVDASPRHMDFRGVQITSKLPIWDTSAPYSDGAISFNGGGAENYGISDTSIAEPDWGALQSADEWAICARVCPRAGSTSHTVFSNISGQSEYGVALVLSSGDGSLVGFVVADGGSYCTLVSAAVEIDVGTSYDIAVVNSAGTISIYVDDMETPVASEDWVAASQSIATRDAKIGVTGDGEGFSPMSLKGLAICFEPQDQIALERWFSWMGGADFSSDVPEGEGGGFPELGLNIYELSTSIPNQLTAPVLSLTEELPAPPTIPLVEFYGPLAYPHYGLDLEIWDADTLSASPVLNWASDKGSILVPTGSGSGLFYTLVTTGPGGANAVACDGTGNNSLGTTFTPSRVGGQTVICECAWDADGPDTQRLFRFGGSGIVEAVASASVFRVSGNPGIISVTEAVRDGNWHLIGGVIAPSGGNVLSDVAPCSLIFDGVVAVGRAISELSTSGMGIGDHPGGPIPFKGRVHKIYYWQGLLTAAQIEHFVATKGY